MGLPWVHTLAHALCLSPDLTEPGVRREASQSLQCMEMAAEGALEIAEDPGSCRVVDSFTALVEAKPTPKVSSWLWASALASATQFLRE